MDEELKKTIGKSGNTLHIETVNLLEKMGWKATLSSYYYDDTANKPREIDIIAEINFPITGSFPAKAFDDFKLFLFIECKYFQNEVAFWMRMNKEEEAKEAMIIEAVMGVDKWDKELILEKEGLFREHHYLQERFIGKLYDSKNEKPIFDAITQPIKALTFFKERRTEKGIYYLVVVYSGIDGIYAIKRENADLDKLEPKKRLILGLDYSYKSVVDNKLKTQQFFIDFVHKDELGNFIEDSVWKEAQELKKYLWFLYKVETRQQLVE